MKAHRGQVALYLVMVILALAVLMIVNVNAFLAVRSKNRMMNAVDMATLAVAKYQGSLLNEVGRMNVEHLRAAIRGEPWTDEAGVDKMIELKRMVFLDPVKAIAEANHAARDWGYAGGESPEALSGFRDHIAEIRNNPDLYPPGATNEKGENLWQVYASALESALSGSPAILPSFMEMANPGTSGLFANRAFYDVIAGKAWCWFTVGNNAQYLDMNPTQLDPPHVYPVEVPENSEVFSLHVTYKGWLDSAWADEYDGSAFSEKWTNFVCQVTGLTTEDFSPHSTAADPSHVWAFYDDYWKPWSATFNPDNFPIAGSVRPEYDVAGCFASCMMIGHIQQLRRDDKTESVNSTLVTAEAKPLGTVDLPEGGVGPVTAYHSFIAPSRPGDRIFTEAQLVLMGSVPRPPGGCSMAPGWYDHIKKHSPDQPQVGCSYCSLWAKWLDPSFRAAVRSWLSQNKESCRPKGGSGPVQKGGYEYAH